MIFQFIAFSVKYKILFKNLAFYDKFTQCITFTYECDISLYAILKAGVDILLKNKLQFSLLGLLKELLCCAGGHVRWL